MAEEDTTVVRDDAYYIELGKQAAAKKAPADAGAGAPVETPAPFNFGPMASVGSTKPTPTQPAAPLTDAEKEDALVARILAAVQKGESGAAPAPTQPAKPASKEDQRVLDLMSRLFPTGRDTSVLSRVSIATNLYLVEVSYTPYSGVKHTSELLLFDDGDKKQVVFRAD